jgi:tetratricopeptide (TPR) repeat protein
MNADPLNRTRLAGACALLCVLGVVPRAQAAEPAVAEALFREGKALLGKGDLAAACPKLEQSERLDPSSGTMVNLALCHEKQGKTATAWAEYLVAARMARTQGKAERAQAAERYASALEPKLSYLTISVSSKAPGMVIRRSGTELDESALGSRLPVDPGNQVLTVSAPGKKSLELKLEIKANGDAQSVVIPRLEDDASAAAPAPSGASNTSAPETTAQILPAHHPDAGQKTRTVGWVVGGAGIAALAVGGLFGVFALTSYGDAEKQCQSRVGCSKDAIAKRDSAETQANIANIGIGVGIVGIGVGAVLVLTASRASSQPAQGSLHVTPVANRDVAGVLIGSAF